MQSEDTEINDSVFNLEYAHSVPTLSKAVKQGDLTTIRKLLLKGSLPQTPDNRGWTPIHHCAASSNFEALKLILRLKRRNKKYLVNLQTWENDTPLSLALKAPTPSLKIVQLLLKSGASPNICSPTNLSPLHVACKKNGNLAFVKALIEHGANVNLQEDLSKYTPLHFAICEAKDLPITKYLMEMSDIFLEDSFGLNAFAEACNYGFVEAVKLFIAKDKSLVTASNPVPPIVHALVWGNLELTQLLYESGADFHTKCKAYLNCNNDSEIIVLDTDSYLPIHSSMSNLEVFRFVLSATKVEDICESNTNHCTFPLFVLVYSPNLCFIEEVVSSSALPDELKTITSRVIVNFLIDSPNMSDTVFKRFHAVFKYNFYLDPDDVFQNFVCLMTAEELRRNVRFIHFLAQTGISSDQQSNKTSVVEIFKDLESNLVKDTCECLMQPVLSLKQLSRIVLRRWLRSKTENDWSALKVLEESKIPTDIKKYISFER